MRTMDRFEVAVATVLIVLLAGMFLAFGVVDKAEAQTGDEGVTTTTTLDPTVAVPADPDNPGTVVPPAPTTTTIVDPTTTTIVDPDPTTTTTLEGATTTIIGPTTTIVDPDPTTTTTKAVVTTTTKPDELPYTGVGDYLPLMAALGAGLVVLGGAGTIGTWVKGRQ